ncbi:hypothetical protein D3C76_1824850 [compost metagenome]
MAKPRKFPNNPLKVANPATSHTGENDPIAIPSAMAIRIFGSKPSFFMFMLLSPTDVIFV